MPELLTRTSSRPMAAHRRLDHRFSLVRLGDIALHGDCLAAG
jgi:hypothetical protein